MSILQAIISSLYVTALVTMLYVVVRFTVRGLLFLYAVKSGAPYVPTTADIDRILLAQPIKKGSQFLEVGCGDGRVVARAVSLLEVAGTGIDIDPLLIAQAKKGVTDAQALHFLTANIHDHDTAPYDTFYLFLLPKLLVQTADKIQKERQGKPTLIISHAFQIEPLQDALTHIEPGNPYETYYYRL